MTATRQVKLAWITIVCALLGYFVARALGAPHWSNYLALIGAPALLGIVSGLVGLDRSGEARNQKVVLWLGLMVGIALFSTLAFFVHALLNSTDL